jgi:cold-inducible RNA-binding protein
LLKRPGRRIERAPLTGLEALPAFVLPPRADFEVVMQNRLYVGNLSFSTKEETLRSTFAAIGPVERVDMPMDRETGRPRGFGFVTMTNEADAKKAIEALDGSQLDGRPLRVNVAEERKPRGGGGGGGGFGGGGGGGGGRGGRGGGDRW